MVAASPSPIFLFPKIVSCFAFVLAAIAWDVAFAFQPCLPSYLTSTFAVAVRSWSRFLLLLLLLLDWPWFDFLDWLFESTGLGRIEWEQVPVLVPLLGGEDALTLLASKRRGILDVTILLRLPIILPAVPAWEIQGKHLVFIDAEVVFCIVVAILACGGVK
jgi:hypothetical protein